MSADYDPCSFFTGSVRVDPLMAANAQINSSHAYVTLEPCALSAWHTHPVGQYLVLTSATKEWGVPIQELRPGDVVWCPPR